MEQLCGEFSYEVWQSTAQSAQAFGRSSRTGRGNSECSPRSKNGTRRCRFCL